jgi:hypothetical protein
MVKNLSSEKFNFSTLTYCKIAGLMYLLIAFIGGFSIMYVPETLFVLDDASLTVQNISDNLGLFKAGILGDLFVILAEVVLSVLLYVLFKSVNKTFSLVAFVSRFAMAVVMSINLLFSIFILFMVKFPEKIVGFTTEQISSFVLFFINLHSLGIFIWQFFFFLHCLFIGYLIYKSGFAPKLIGLFLSIGSFGYLFDAIRNTIFIDSIIFMIISSIFLFGVVIGEFWLAGWLLFKGIKN